MINRYSIETPPYAKGRLIKDESGKILKLDEVGALRPSKSAQLQGYKSLSAG